MKEYEGFEKFLLVLYNIDLQSFVITYIDIYGDLLLINNNENFQKVFSIVKLLLRIMVQMKGDVVLFIKYKYMYQFFEIQRKK